MNHSKCVHHGDDEPGQDPLVDCRRKPKRSVNNRENVGRRNAHSDTLGVYGSQISVLE